MRRWWCCVAVLFFLTPSLACGGDGGCAYIRIYVMGLANGSASDVEFVASQPINFFPSLPPPI